MILRFVPSASFKFWGCFFFSLKIESSHKNHPQRTTQPAVMILYFFPTCNSTVPSVYLFKVLRIICILCSIACLIKDWVFTKWKYSFSLSINIVWKDCSIFIFSKVVSYSWRCGYYRPKTAIMKWTCPLILTSSPIFEWGFFGHPWLLGRVLKNRVCLSFHPSFRLAVTFLGIGLSFFFFFLKFSRLLGAHIWLYVTGPDFFGKNPHCAKMTQIDQKWPKNRDFGLSRKIMSLVLSGICVKWKFIRFINNLQNLHVWEKLSSQVIAKNGTLPMRFQYSLIINVSLIH